MARIAPSTTFASVPTDGLGQGDRINLGVAAILGHRPEVAGALGSLKAALQASGTLPPRLVELVRLPSILFLLGLLGERGQTLIPHPIEPFPHFLDATRVEAINVSGPLSL